METLKRNRVHSRMYYRIGNTPPYNVTLGCRIDKHCDMLLLGCGDIRNVLYTTYGLQQNLAVSPTDQALNFNLNDNECGVLTRDLILFHITKTINPEDEADMKFLWGVWYDVLLSRNHSDRLKMVMKKLTKQMSGDLDIYFGDEDTEQSVKRCLESWSNDQTGPEEMIKERSQFLMTLYEEDLENPTKRVVSKAIKMYHTFENERMKDRYRQEVQEYTDLGTTRINTAHMSQKMILATFCVNPTFLPSDCKKWITPDDSTPFLSYDFERELERYDGAKTTVANICLEMLKEWTKCFQTVEKRCKLQIYLWLNDAKNLCEKTLSEDQTYDFIDTSNLADDMGLIPLIVCCQRKLKEDSGVLRTESFDWHYCLSHGEHFLRLCLDISPLMYPTVLGLHLAEELSIGHENHCQDGMFEGVNKMVFRWKKAASFTPCVLTGSDSLSLCLKTIRPAPDKKTADAFQNVTPALCDDNTKRKLVVRLTDEVSRPSDQQVNQVIELNDRYEVKIETPHTYNPGDLTLKHVDCNKRAVSFKITTDKSTQFSTTLHFSCPVSLQGHTVSHSKKKRLIKGCLMKDQGLTVGERVLPWKLLTSSDVLFLPDYPLSPFSEKTMLDNIMMMYPNQDYTSAVHKDNAYPLHQLQDIFIYLLFAAPKSETRKVYILRKTSRGDSILERYQCGIALEGLRLFENKPAAFVTVYNHDEVMQLIGDGKVTSLDFIRMAEVSEADEELSESLLQGFDILRTILQINSCRLNQDSVDSRWVMRSFVRVRYPFKTFMAYVYETGIREKYTEAGRWKHPLAMYQFLEEIRSGKGYKHWTSPAGRELFQETMSNFKPVCDCCGKMTDCKTCTACNIATYCSRSCQRKAWPQHKLQCNK